jgi:hypothetical protein
MTQQTRVLKKKGTLQVIRRVLPIRHDIAYSFCFTGTETEIHKIKDDSKIIMQTSVSDPYSFFRIRIQRLRLEANTDPGL